MNTKSILPLLDEVIAKRRSSSEQKSYVAKLNNAGLEAILKKLAEENLEVSLAAIEIENTNTSKSSKKILRENLANEVADYWFHSIVLLHRSGLTAEDVLEVLKERFGKSGLD